MSDASFFHTQICTALRTWLRIVAVCVRRLLPARRIAKYRSLCENREKRDTNRYSRRKITATLNAVSVSKRFANVIGSQTRIKPKKKKRKNEKGRANIASVCFSGVVLTFASASF